MFTPDLPLGDIPPDVRETAGETRRRATRAAWCLLDRMADDGQAEGGGNYQCLFI
jgi:hypothetical protein